MTGGTGDDIEMGGCKGRQFDRRIPEPFIMSFPRIFVAFQTALLYLCCHPGSAISCALWQDEQDGAFSSPFLPGLSVHAGLI